MKSVTFTPGSSTALLRSSRSSSPSGMVALSKYFGLGLMLTRVPEAGSSRSAGRCASFSASSPSAKAMVWASRLPRASLSPLRQTVTSSLLASALVTDTPTPCRPPEKL